MLASISTLFDGILTLYKQVREVILNDDRIGVGHFVFFSVQATRGVARPRPGEKLKVHTHTYPHAEFQRLFIFCSIFMFDDTFLLGYEPYKLRH